MAKRQTKADAILLDSEMRVEAARIREQTARSQLNAATATREALEGAHAALEKALAPKSRKKTVPAPAAQKDLLTDKDPKEPLCGVCGNAEDYQDHFKPSPNYHEFDPPKGKKKLAAVQGSSAA